MSRTPAGSCREVQEGLTEYLENALPPERRRGLEVHLSTCDACRSLALELLATIYLLSTPPPESMPPGMKRILLRALHGFQSA